MVYTKSFNRYFTFVVVCLCDGLLTLREDKIEFAYSLQAES
jgi:hypothetical protein